METCGNMRALLLAGAAQYDELFMGLKTLEVAFQNSVKDLRSQVKKIVIFYTKILTGKVVLWCFFSSETSEKIHNSTFQVKISV